MKQPSVTSKSQAELRTIVRREKTVEVIAVNKIFDPTRHYLWPVPLKERDLILH